MHNYHEINSGRVKALVVVYQREKFNVVDVAVIAALISLMYKLIVFAMNWVL